MPNSARLRRVGHVCLVEYILTLRGVIVGGKRDLGLIRAHGAGHIVLVRPVIGAELRTVANGPLVRQVFDGRCPKIYMRLYATVVGIAEEGRNVYVQRPALKRRNATVGDSGVDVVFVAEREICLFVGSECQRRVYAVPLQINAVSEALG